jgi:hypothetical protein
LGLLRILVSVSIIPSEQGEIFAPVQKFTFSLLRKNISEGSFSAGGSW